MSHVSYSLTVDSFVGRSTEKKKDTEGSDPFCVLFAEPTGYLFFIFLELQQLE